jgi:nucleotide-binding universal stress UspA family protein
MDQRFIERVLIPTDMTELAAPALRYGHLIRERLGARITVLHADESLAAATLVDHPLGYYLENQPERVRDLTEEVRTHAMANGLGSVPFEARVSLDGASAAILSAASRDPFDLIVMTTHGRRGWQRAVLGSVTERVLHRAPCPVLTIAPRVAATSDGAIRRVLCPVDGTPAARNALSHACEWAAAFDAELYVLQIASRSTSMDSAEETYRRWIPPGLRRKTSYREVVVTNDLSERIVKAASYLEADFIVMGVEHHLFRDTLAGSTTHDVTRRARCAVLLVRAGQELHREEHAAEIVGAERL